MHLYVADLSRKGGRDVACDKSMLAGEKISEPCYSPIGYLGLSVSYDLRFPELYRKLILHGA
jgi:predicted amidohydrolase